MVEEVQPGLWASIWDGWEAANEKRGELRAREGGGRGGQKEGGCETQQACPLTHHAPGISYLKFSLSAPQKPFHTANKDAPGRSFSYQGRTEAGYWEERTHYWEEREKKNTDEERIVVSQVENYQEYSAFIAYRQTYSSFHQVGDATLPKT